MSIATCGAAAGTASFGWHPSKPSSTWTVVPRPANAVNMPPSWGSEYAVCPSCRHRERLPGHPKQLRCERCQSDFAVAWDEHYQPAF
jgi:hypothetical protein